jgi:hypothetical protein
VAALRGGSCAIDGASTQAEACTATLQPGQEEIKTHSLRCARRHTQPVALGTATGLHYPPSAALPSDARLGASELVSRKQQWGPLNLRLHRPRAAT